ncbi:MAG: type II secretion system F family protein [Candidatus Melainabacteria bacterium]|nr:type II secretion system F family protein [Candidatus Melainabacteria bacterium]
MNFTNLNITNFVAIFAFSILAGALAVRLIKISKRRKQVARRVQQALSSSAERQLAMPVLVAASGSAGNIAAGTARDTMTASSLFVSILKPQVAIPKFAHLPAPLWLVRLVEQSAITMSISDFVLVLLICGLAPGLIAYIFAVPELICLALSLVCCSLPLIYIAILAARKRTKFIEQLPDAIDLMVSVLRTGHSVPQAVRSVGKESAQPLGEEFSQILQRINLGQPFSEALTSTVAKYKSDELDLIRRAITIQAEVGGSLAELLEKTNLTLRQRLKLKRQVRVLTSQSRLTGIIVGLLPLMLGTALEFLSPGYLEPLFTSDLGRMLLVLAVVLECVGIVLINKMTEVKI